MAGQLRAYLEKKAAALDDEALELERLDKKLAQEEAWLRQGVKARRTRNEGRVRDSHGAARGARRAARRRPARCACRSTPRDASGKLVFEAEDVSKSFGGAPVIRDYSQRILRGDRVGLIGPNGSGKTTLLRLLVGELEPDAGTIRRGARLQVAYFDQQREQLDPDRTVADTVNDGNDTRRHQRRSRATSSAISPTSCSRASARCRRSRLLSGGERNRLMLARLFARPANVLVLDEPTNDLDIETLELLEELVGDFDGTVLLVSHDRVFLDRIVTSTLAFEGDGRVTEYVGGYEDYLRQSQTSGERPRPERGDGLPAGAPARLRQGSGGQPSRDRREGWSEPPRTAARTTASGGGAPRAVIKADWALAKEVVVSRVSRTRVAPGANPRTRRGAEAASSRSSRAGFLQGIAGSHTCSARRGSS